MKFESQESFGEYFDSQRARLENYIKDKNKQLNVEWKEQYDKRNKTIRKCKK